MRPERREFFTDHAGKGFHLSIYEAETGILWMWAGLVCFLSSGDGYVGNFLCCSKGVKDPLEVSEFWCEKPRGLATDPLIHVKGHVTLLLQVGRKAHVHAPTRD